jgi:DNA polymerase-1
MTPDKSAEEVIKRLADSSTQESVIDVETSGLDWRKNSIVGWVFTFGPRPDDSYYVPVRHGGGANLNNWPGLKDAEQKDDIHPFEIELQKVLTRRGKTLRNIYHNAMFDTMMASGQGLDLSVNLMEDTSVNQPMLNEYARSYSLSACCIEMGVQEKKGEDLYKHLANLFGGEPTRDQMGNFWRLAGDDVIGVDYAVGDGTSTWQLLQAQRAEINRQDMAKIHDIERRLTRTLYRMTRRGVLVNEEKLHDTIVEVERRLEEARGRLPSDFNEKSPKQVEQFMRKHGITNWPRTPKGKPSFNKEWLETNEPGRIIITARKFSHMLNSFLLPLRDRHLHNGYVHPIYHQLRDDDFGTITGRLSCTNPNLQQAHKRNKELGKILRALFHVPQGYKWRSADYSQCEPRLLAHYGKVRVLLEGYWADPPVDAHSAVAAEAGIDRQAGKTLNQSLITGAGRRRIVSELGDRGDEIYDRYFMAMPEVKVLQAQASARMRAVGYIVSLLGRRVRLEPPRYVDGIYKEFSYKAVNRLLQTGNADIIKKAMVDIDEYFESEGDLCRLLNNVHDSLDFEYPEDEAGGRLMQEAMRLMVDYGPGKSVELRVPMGIEYGDGNNWAEATWPDEEHYLQ